jgi:hypothetical protein
MKIGVVKQPEIPADVKLLSEIRDILAKESAGEKSGPPGDAAKRP